MPPSDNAVQKCSGDEGPEDGTELEEYLQDLRIAIDAFGPGEG